MSARSAASGIDGPFPSRINSAVAATSACRVRAFWFDGPDVDSELFA
jgi:hypothetical protein